MALKTNQTPKYDVSDNPTGCCPRFDPEGWDEEELHFENKLFIRAETRSFLHVPLNIGKVFSKTCESISKANAKNDDQFIVLSNDLSRWKSEHYFAVTKDVPDEEVVKMSGDYLTKVFEGPFKNVPKWDNYMKKYIQGMGKEAEKVYFFYTTCPKCAKYYGKNYVVGFGKMA